MSTDLDVDSMTTAVRQSFDNTSDVRVREILLSLTDHLHDFIREVSPSIEEWGVAIDFLTRTGQTCTETRQEFVLLSDALGVSMLVETINGMETPDATESTVLGPFHMTESPRRALGDDISPQGDGRRCVVEGRIVSADGTAIPDATIDIWQANADGFYDVQQPEEQSRGNGRALLISGPEGEFRFVSRLPSFYPIPTDGPVGELLAIAGRHPNRPAHIHFLVTAPGFHDLTTHIFVAGSPYIESDAVFAVRRSLVKEFIEDADVDRAAAFGVDVPFLHSVFDIVLAPNS